MERSRLGMERRRDVTDVDVIGDDHAKALVCDPLGERIQLLAVVPAAGLLHVLPERGAPHAEHEVRIGA